MVAPSFYSLTVGIAARNRPQALAQCLASLRLIEQWIHRVVIIDDASSESLEAACVSTLETFPKTFRQRFNFIRRGSPQGYIVARNEIVQEAGTEAVLILDDDAYLLPNSCVEDARTILEGDGQVIAVAFACCDSHGKRLPLYMQPSPVDYRCLVNSHIGYSHFLRRSAFLHLGGYQEMLEAYGEEKEFCLRAWDAGWRVVYCPDSVVVHTHNLVGRDYDRGAGINARNTIYGALLNYPWPLPLLAAVGPLRHLAMHRRTLRGRWGVCGVLGKIWKVLPQLLRARRAVRWRTIWEWRQRARQIPRYSGPVMTDK